MLVAILTDTHIGARKTSQYLHDYFEKFYNEVFFPTLDKHNVKTIIHMGDCFDNRKSIDYKAIEWGKRVIFDPAAERGIDFHIITGNHDVYFKNTNNLNSPELLLQNYSNIKVYKEPTEVKLGGLEMLFLPWINQENEELSLNAIKKTSCRCSLGHLELQGFRVNRQIIMEHGLDSKLFEKFSHVFSGHYHTRSSDGRISYLGNPYEMYWTDVNDTRGFHIFDTETLTLTPINNPYKLFYNIYYEDTNYKLFNATEYENKIVKVIVRKKTSPKDFERFIDKLHSVGIQDLKIVENFDVHESEEFDIDEEESTISILNRYIDESEFEFDKNVIKGIFQDLYRQACEVE